MKTEAVEESEVEYRARKLIMDGKSDAVSGFMKIGAGFALVVEFKLHRLQKQTLAQYIAETGMSWAKAHQAMSCWRRFGNMDTRGILHSRLIELSPIRMTDEEKELALVKAKELGPRDFERFVAEKKGKTLPEVCPHLKQVTICTKCRAKLA